MASKPPSGPWHAGSRCVVEVHRSKACSSLYWPWAAMRLEPLERKADLAPEEAHGTHKYCFASFQGLAVILCASAGHITDQAVIPTPSPSSPAPAEASRRLFLKGRSSRDRTCVGRRFLGREGPASSTSPHSQAPDRVGGARRPSCRGGRTRGCLMKASRLYTKKALKVLKMAQKRRLAWCLFAQLFAGLKVRIRFSKQPTTRIGPESSPCEAQSTANQHVTPPVLRTSVRAHGRRHKSRPPKNRRQQLHRRRLVICENF